jgi:hypothetical protein
MSASDRFGGLSKRSAIIIGAVILIGLIHHTDHVLRVDHSGWPFRADLNPFTFSLLAYPSRCLPCLGQLDCSGCAGSFSWWEPGLPFGHIS